MDKLYSIKKNNRGLSLVELIVAISVGVLISGAIVALISFSIRIYRDEKANLAAQYELQTNVNQIVDTIMSANDYVIQSSTGTPISPTDIGGTLKSDTHYAAFGEYKDNKFKGVIFVAGPEKKDDEGNGTGKFDIFMDRAVRTGASGSNAGAIVKAWAEDIAKKKDESPNPYLLGEDATAFRIEPKVKSITEGVKTYVNITPEGFVNPLGVEIQLDFQKDATGKVVNKHVEDEALIRNKISTDIYINGTAYSLKRKSD
ncbi:MAG: prepilin-type N-terminal cleavage/methylation domain-containing protein [Lachnospiraceae bacterium]|nr:prepilin-type N-terminal cleavage/methylation domain-containing protein [Lachnospiraceae bacterium]